ncbi:hypothetical protein QT23_00375 [Staphylococcus aureus]|nr:hypothetical protein QT23_00375 [Staphylococcus aureus]
MASEATGVAESPPAGDGGDRIVGACGEQFAVSLVQADLAQCLQRGAIAVSTKTDLQGANADIDCFGNVFDAERQVTVFVHKCDGRLDIVRSGYFRFTVQCATEIMVR